MYLVPNLPKKLKALNLKHNILTSKYDKCFEYGKMVGCNKDGELCTGEQMHPRAIKTDCFYCPYFKIGDDFIGN